jgi:predicted DNA-binding protein
MDHQDEVKFTLKLNPELAEKLNYIASYYGRTRSGEIIWTLRRHVIEFEKKFGPITEEEYRGI